MNNLKLLLIVLCVAFAFGCDDKKASIPNRVPIIEVDHTLFVYIGNLGRGTVEIDGEKIYGVDIMDYNITEMLAGLNASRLGGSVLIFYDKLDGENTELVKLSLGSSGVYERRVVKTYNENKNTSDINTLKLAIRDLKEFSPSKGYSMILSSHGSGWIVDDIVDGKRPRSLDDKLGNNELTFTPKPSTRAFADEKGFGSGMDIEDLAAALPAGMFDFILFDACLMGCVEVVYPLRDKADFVIAALSEVLLKGFPYKNIMGDLFDKSSVEDALTRVCKEFADYYKDDYQGSMYGYNIALYKTSEVDAMTASFAAIVDDVFDEMQSVNPSASRLQWFDAPVKPHIAYDMQAFVDICNVSPGLVTQFTNSLNDMIPYKATAETSLGSHFFMSPVKAFCGISIYIPQPSLPLTNEYYMTTDWYKAAYGDKVLFAQ